MSLLKFKNIYVQECSLRLIKQVISRYPNTVIWYLISANPKSTNPRLFEHFHNSELAVVWKAYLEFGSKLLKLNGAKNQEIASLLASLEFQPATVSAPKDMFLSLKLPIEDESHFSFMEKPLQFFDIMKSLQKPIKLWFQCTNGQKIPLLLKFNDEIRKDNRVLDFFAHFNHLKKGMTFNNILKVYSAIPLSDTSGLIEWIDGIQTMRQIVNQYSKRSKRDIDMLKSKTVLQAGREGLLKLIEQYVLLN